MVKMILWLSKEEMGSDAVYFSIQMDHDVHTLEDELKFEKCAELNHYYLLNYSSGDRKITSKDFYHFTP